MVMTPGLRKFMLTLHIIFAVGWLGAVAGFLVLAIAGLISDDEQMVQSVYLCIPCAGIFGCVTDVLLCFFFSLFLFPLFFFLPLRCACLVTGPILSLGIEWCLFQYYCFLAKLFLTFIRSESTRQNSGQGY